MRNKMLALILACSASQAYAGFDVVALGVHGGVEEGNLTSYLIRSDDQKLYLGWMPVRFCRGSARRSTRALFLR